MIGSAWYRVWAGYDARTSAGVDARLFFPPASSRLSRNHYFQPHGFFTSVVWFASWRRSAEKNYSEQELLKEALASEQQAPPQAETADRLKDEFLATVSHELRTPLSAILGLGSMLNLGELEEQTRAMRCGDRTQRESAGRKFRRHSGRFADYHGASCASKQRPWNSPRCPVSSRNAATGSRRESDFAFNFSGPETRLVAADPDRLQQIVWNLVSNAIKFTPKGGRVEVQLAAGGFTTRVNCQR